MAWLGCLIVHAAQSTLGSEELPLIVKTFILLGQQQALGSQESSTVQLPVSGCGADATGWLAAQLND
jgi:hypothetical protein